MPLTGSSGVRSFQKGWGQPRTYRFGEANCPWGQARPNRFPRGTDTGTCVLPCPACWAPRVPTPSSNPEKLSSHLHSKDLSQEFWESEKISKDFKPPPWSTRQSPWAKLSKASNIRNTSGKGLAGTFGGYGRVLYLDCGGGHLTACGCQNWRNCTPTE